MANLKIGIDARAAIEGAKAVGNAFKGIVAGAAKAVSAMTSLGEAAAKPRDEFGRFIAQEAGLLGFLKKITSNVVGLLNPLTALQSAVNLVFMAFEGLKNVVGFVVSILNPLNLLSAAFNILKGVVSVAMGAFSSLFSAVQSGLQFFANLSLSIQGLMSALAPIGNAVQGVINAFQGAVTTSADFQVQISNIQAVSLSTAEDINKIREAALAVGRDTPLAATTAAEAMLNFAKAGLSAEEAIASLAPSVNAALASGSDLAAVSETVISITNAMGLGFENTAKTLDILLTTTTKTATSMEGLGMGMSFVAPTLDAMNQSLETGAAVLGKLADAGFKGSRAGTGLNQILLKLASPTAKINAMFSDLGFKLNTMTGKFEELNPETNNFIDILEKLENAGINSADAISAFGIRAGPQLGAAIKQGSASIRELETALKDSAGTGAKMFEIQVDNLSKSMISLEGSVESLNISIGDTAQQGFKLIVDEAILATNAFKNFIAESGLLEGATNLITAASKEVVEIFNLFKPAIDPVLEVLQAFGGYMTMSTESWSKWVDGASTALTASSSFNSILKSVGATLATYLSSFLEWVTNTGNLESAFNTAVGIGKQFYEMISSIGNIAGSVASGVLKIAQNFITLSKNSGFEIDIVGGLKKTFQDAKTYIMGDAKKTLESGLSQIGPFIATHFTDLSTPIRTALNDNDWDAAFGIFKDKAKEHFIDAWDYLIKETPQKIKEWVAAVDKVVGPSIREIFSKAEVEVKAGLKKIVLPIRVAFLGIQVMFKQMAPMTSKAMEGAANRLDLFGESAEENLGVKVPTSMTTTDIAIKALAQTSEEFKTKTTASWGASTESMNNFATSADSDIAAYKASIASMQGDSVDAYNQHIASMKTQFEETQAFSEEFAKGGQAVGLSYATKFADGMKQGYRQISDVTSDIAAIIDGHSPPDEGPLKNIDIGGQNVALAWSENFVSTLKGVVPAVQPIFSQLNGSLSALSTLGNPGGSREGVSGGMGSTGIINDSAITENRNVNQNTSNSTKNEMKFNVNVNGTGTPSENRQAGITFAQAAQQYMQKNGVTVR